MEPGYILNQYVFVEWLGEGGMAEVWRGRHVHLEYEVAIKFLKPQFAHDSDLQERFLNEGKRQANLDHPNIVRAIDFISDNGRNFLVMKYVEAGGLDRRIEELHGPLPVEEALAISYQVLSAIDYAHRQGVIHRDVKPSNILMDRDGNCYLTDFGIALAAGQQRFTRTGTVMGTDYYMSPEQIRTPRKVDHRTDVYAFGVVLFEMLTGVVPFDYDNEFLLKKAHVEQAPPKPSKLNPAISKALESVVLRALAKEPDDRWSGCEEMAEAIAVAVRGTRPPVRGTRPRTTPGPIPIVADSSENGATPRPLYNRRGRLLALAGGGAAAVLAIVFGVRTMGHAGESASRNEPTRAMSQQGPGSFVAAHVSAVPVTHAAGAPGDDDRGSPLRVSTATPAPNHIENERTPPRVTPEAPVDPPKQPIAKVIPSGRSTDTPETAATAPPVAETQVVLLARWKSQIATDPVGARESLRKSAADGNPQAMVLLGTMYSQGLGGDKDYAEAVRMFRQAADLGYDHGMFYLGLMYENDKGVPAAPGNQAEAANWYTKALKSGKNSQAAYRLGIMYEEGRGVPKDLSQAARFYRMAATPEASARLARIPSQ